MKHSHHVVGGLAAMGVFVSSTLMLASVVLAGPALMQRVAVVFADTTNPNIVLSVSLYNTMETDGDANAEAHVFQPGDTLTWGGFLKNIGAATQQVTVSNFCDQKVSITRDGEPAVLFTYPSDCTSRNFTWTIPSNQMTGVGGSEFVIPPTFTKGTYALTYTFTGVGTIVKHFRVGYIPPIVTPNALGVKNMIVLLLQYDNSMPKQFTEQQVHDYIFGDGYFNRYYKEQSYGNLSFVGDVYWVSVHGKNMTAAEIPDHPDIVAFIRANNIDLSKYQFMATIANPPVNSTDPLHEFGGSSGKFRPEIDGAIYNLSEVGLSGADQFAYVPPASIDGVYGSLAHEIGHTLYYPLLTHANAKDCGTQTLGTNCRNVEYGNPFDVMGATNFASHFNGFYKEVLGWVPVSRILTVSKSGRYTINSLESPTGIAFAKIQSSTSTMPLYYLEWRQGIGFDAALNRSNLAANKQGLLVTIPSYEFTSPRSYLLDMVPGATGQNDIYTYSLNVGAPAFVDAEHKVSIKVVSVGTDSITFDVTMGSTPIPTTASVDLKANGSDGPLTVTNGFATLSWTSQGVSSCSYPAVVPLGTFAPKSFTNYPVAVTAPTVYKISCVTAGGTIVTDSVAIAPLVPKPTCGIFPSSSFVRSNSSFNIVGSTNNATSMTYSLFLGSTSVVQDTPLSLTFNTFFFNQALRTPGVYTYVGKVTGAGGTGQCSTTVTVLP